MSLDNLKLLESKIVELVARHERVRQAQEALQQQVREQEKQLGEAAARIKQFEKEREDVRGRVDKVLSRLEGIDLS